MINKIIPSVAKISGYRAALKNKLKNNITLKYSCFKARGEVAIEYFKYRY